MINTLFRSDRPTIVGALHLPPFPASRHPQAQPLSVITEFAIRNVERAVESGVDAIYLQDLGDHPIAPTIEPHTVAGVTAVGEAVRRAFPKLPLGICLMGHGAREPLAIVQAIEGQFVRLKVFIGAMVKWEGILEGCAYEAQQYRARLGAKDDILILADVHDRTGSPLGRPPLAQAARDAAVFGRADGLVLTGSSFEESVEMLRTVHEQSLDVPLLIGGGVKAANVGQLVGLADGMIVSSAFKPSAKSFSRASLTMDWKPARIRALVQALEEASCAG